VTFVGPVSVPVWLAAKKGFEDKSSELGMSSNWAAPAGAEIPAIVGQLQNALTAGADGLVTCALDPKAFEPVLEEAKSDGVPVVLTDCDVEEEDLRAAYVGTVGKTFGEQSAERLSELVNDKAEIIVMQGQLDAAIQNEIYDGFKAGIADKPGMKVVAREADDSEVQEAVEKFGTLFNTHPDATAVYCIEAGCGEAAVTAAREAGNLDQLTIMGTDDNPGLLDDIRKGDVAVSAAQPFELMGRLAAQFLADVFEGKKPPSVTDTGVIFITKENVDSFSQEALEREGELLK
jgi:ribose transport system substrate-binding protein